MGKAADQLVDVIRDIIIRELEKRDTTVLCQVVNKKGAKHFDVCVVPDTDTRITNVLNPSSLDIKVGDFVYVYKINNQLNNSFIVSKIMPYADNKEMTGITTLSQKQFFPLSYIRSTGIQYIDTEIVPGNDIIKIEICVASTAPTSTQAEDRSTGCIIGAGTADTAGNGWGFYEFPNNGPVADQTDKHCYAFLSPGVVWHTFGNEKYNKDKHIFSITINGTNSIVTMDNVEIGNETDEHWDLNKPWRSDSLKICCGSYGQGRNEFIGKIYWCKIYKNDTIVRNYTPMGRTQDNAIGMLDQVSNTFFGNAGDGEFYHG